MATSLYAVDAPSLNSITQALDAGASTKGVATPDAAVRAASEDWEMIEALLGGTRKMRERSTALLPKWPNESDEKYTRRLRVSTLFPAFKRTVVTLASRPFSKPIARDDDIPGAVVPFLDNVDLQGRNLDAFAHSVFEEAVLGYGFGGILVDHKRAPQTTGAPLSVAAEKAAGMRPYMVYVRCAQILGWKAKAEDDEYTLTQLRIMESVEEDDGEFGKKQVPQVRVLEPGKWRTFRKPAAAQAAAGTEQWVKYENGTTTLDYIPFVPVYGERLGFMCGRSSLMDLGYLNVKHWQSQSDQDNLMHVARVPILGAYGIQDSPDKPFKLIVGGSGAIKMPEGSDLKYTEHSGNAIGAGKQSLDDLKEEMRQAGAELLVLKPGPTTATEVASDNAVGMCDLQRLTLNFQDALNTALQFMADWVNAGDGGHVELFTDFAAATLAEASMQIVVSMGNAGYLTKKTVINEGRRRGIVSSEVDPETELAEIEAEGPQAKIDPLTGLPYDKPAPPSGTVASKPPPTVQ